MRYRDPESLAGETVGRRVLDLMADLAARTPDAVRDLNTIGLLSHLAAYDDVAFCPLVRDGLAEARPHRIIIDELQNAYFESLKDTP